jgi:hypothetical protein
VEQKRPTPDADDRQAPRFAKKPYAAPVVTEYGSIAKLTQSGAGSISDGTSTNSQLKSCL